MPITPNQQTANRPKRKGQAIVEFAIIFPIFIAIIFALVEFGLYLKDRLGVQYASLEAARTVAAEGIIPPDDSAALLVISSSGLLGLSFDNIYYVEVYQAYTITNACPIHVPACDPNSSIMAPDKHMVYGWIYSAALGTKTWQLDSGYTNDWLPGTRNDIIPTDVAGIHIKYKHWWVNPLLHSPNSYVDINQRILMPIEPSCYSDDYRYCHSAGSGGP